MKEFDEKPKWLQELMLDKQEEQGNKRNPDVFRKKVNEIQPHGGFYWADTKEKYNVWHDAIARDNYEPLYKAHPELRPETEEQP